MHIPRSLKLYHGIHRLLPEYYIKILIRLQTPSLNHTCNVNRLIRLIGWECPFDVNGLSFEFLEFGKYYYQDSSTLDSTVLSQLIYNLFYQLPLILTALYHVT